MSSNSCYLTLSTLQTSSRRTPQHLVSFCQFTWKNNGTHHWFHHFRVIGLFTNLRCRHILSSHRCSCWYILDFWLGCQPIFTKISSNDCNITISSVAFSFPVMKNLFLWLYLSSISLFSFQWTIVPLQFPFSLLTIHLTSGKSIQNVTIQRLFLEFVLKHEQLLEEAKTFYFFRKWNLIRQVLPSVQLRSLSFYCK